MTKIQNLLDRIRACERAAADIVESGGTGSKIAGTVQKLRGIAAELENRLKLLRRDAKAKTAKPDASAPPAEAEESTAGQRP